MKFTVSTCCVALVASHGSVLNPRPRSSHSQTWDDANKCGSAAPYSKATAPGNYCGLGCLGDACLYYQIGCFQGCSTCSLQGKTLYPVPADLTLAGCDAKTMPEPTLGGGNKTHEHEMRSYNIDGDSPSGDWTKWMPWRSPGLAGKGNPDFQPCGVNSGALASQPEPPTTAHDVPNGGKGTALPALPRSEWAVWKAGSVVEAEWAIYANHGGGYSYRLCKKVSGQVETEECYQKTPLDFATPETEIRYKDGTMAPFNITAPTTTAGTFPAGSQWRKNPVPMCNCDIGLSCQNGPAPGPKPPKPPAPGPSGAKYLCKQGKCYEGYGKESKEQCDSTCAPGPAPGPSGKKYVCKQGKCYEGYGKESKEQCDSTCGKQPALPAVFTDPRKSEEEAATLKKQPHKGYFTAYNHTHFRPGQTNKLCPTGVQFATSWDGGAGAGLTSGGFGRLDFTMVDMLQVPDVPPGDYSVSWRWDCEETPQVWNSCSDIIITA